ncbi:MAG TPA: esterase, partial [Ferruginibacter sp.]|nr:esterase [Ferruginibacter sp.]
MSAEQTAGILVTEHLIRSVHLSREVIIDYYLPQSFPVTAEPSLLLINDGQDLRTMVFEDILEDLYGAGEISNLVCIGIHCGTDRKSE